MKLRHRSRSHFLTPCPSELSIQLRPHESTAPCPFFTCFRAATHGWHIWILPGERVTNTWQASRIMSSKLQAAPHKPSHTASPSVISIQQGRKLSHRDWTTSPRRAVHKQQPRIINSNSGLFLTSRSLWTVYKLVEEWSYSGSKAYQRRCTIPGNRMPESLPVLQE